MGAVVRPKTKMSPVARAWLERLAENANTLESKEGGVVLHRQQAQNRLFELGLPTRKDENWQYTSILPLIQKSFQVSQSPLLADLDLSPYLPDFDVNLVVVVDGVYQPSLSQLSGLEKGLTISMSHSLSKDDEVIASDAEAFELVNSMMLDQVLRIVQIKNTASEIPLMILQVQTGENLSATRLELTVEENAEMTVIERFVSLSETAAFVNPKTKLILEKSARLKQVVYQSLNLNSFYFANQSIVQAESSVFNTLYLALGAHIARHQNRLVMGAEQCESFQNSIVFGEGHQVLDSRTDTQHAKANGQSHQLHKFVLKDQAQGVFDGMIYVAQDAQKTDGQMDNRNLILSTDAKMNTKPKLEIYADDVKCSHGCASGQMDDEQVFYMQARGIRRQDAYHLITQAFLLEPLEQVSHSALRNWLTDAVNQKLARLA